MRDIRGAVGCLAVVLAAMGGCADSGPRAHEAGQETPGQQRGALSVGAPELVRDLRPAPPGPVTSPGSAPDSFVKVGDTVFFTATDTLHGRELWATDGTAGGARLVLDIRSGAVSSDPWQLVAFNGALYFNANDGTGARLWRSDGTAAGTRPIYPATFPVGTSGSFLVHSTAVVGGTLYLSVHTDWDTELWKSDGTPEGTVLVKDINAWDVSAPEFLTDVDGTLYFVATDFFTGRELWKSDGTPEGTVLVKDITPGFGASTRFSGLPMVAAGRTLFFVVDDGVTGWELWKSDGTEEGTGLVKDIWTGWLPSQPRQLTAVGNTLYFTAENDVYGREVWRSDGTPEGTVVLKDILQGFSIEPSSLTNVGGVLHFVAWDWEGGNELWKSDGTEAGTVRITDIQPGMAGSVDRILGWGGSSVYFFGPGAGGKSSLWKLDETTAGVVELGTLSGAPTFWDKPQQPVASTGDTLFFAGEGLGLGLEPWKTDGTPAGTVPLRDVEPGATSGSPQYFSDMGGRVLFSVSGPAGKELWRSDGTEAGTRLVRGGFTAIDMWQLKMGGVLYFNASTAESGSELWRTDGTPEGTFLVKDIEPGAGNSFPGSLTQRGGEFFFLARTSTHGYELWKSDGTAEGTVQVKDICPGTCTSMGNAPMLNLGGTLYFPATESATGRELWKTDGTEAGTVQVADLGPGLRSGFPKDLTDMGGTLVFTSTYETTSGRRGLWRLDETGTPQGVTLSAPGAMAIEPMGLNVVDGNLFFFTANSDILRGELWKYDGRSSSATLVTQGRFGYVNFTVHMGGIIYFWTSDEAHGTELWRTDGTDEGTRLVKDIFPGPQSGLERWDALVLEDVGQMLFRATDGEHGLELWVTDGTEEGTRMLADLAPGTLTSNPAGYTRGMHSVFFSADEGTHGSELWRIPLPDLAAPTLTCPGAVRAEATSASGATVSYPEARATDDVTASPAVTYSQLPGTEFPLGKTLVTVTAKDETGKTAECAFEVTVVDTTAPVMTCPEDRTLEATGPAGAPVTYAAATASDALSAEVTYSHDSGSTFPLGATTLTATGRDGQGNTASCAFVVTVRDTTAPTLTCPADLEVRAETESGLPVEYPAATVADAVTAELRVDYSQPSGSLFPVGSALVDVHTTDQAGNTASCSFRITVKPPAKPSVSVNAGSGGCGAAGNAPAGVWGALLLLTWVALRRPSARRS